MLVFSIEKAWRPTILNRVVKRSLKILFVGRLISHLLKTPADSIKVYFYNKFLRDLNSFPTGNNRPHELDSPAQSLYMEKVSNRLSRKYIGRRGLSICEVI